MWAPSQLTPVKWQAKWFNTMLAPGAQSNWPKSSFTWPRVEQKSIVSAKSRLHWLGIFWLKEETVVWLTSRILVSNRVLTYLIETTNLFFFLFFFIKKPHILLFHDLHSLHCFQVDNRRKLEKLVKFSPKLYTMHLYLLCHPASQSDNPTHSTM